MAPAFEHATTFRDAEADALLSGLVEDIEGGYTKRVAFVAPAGPLWALPLYELALMTAERAKGMGMTDVEVTVATPDPAPLAIFGSTVSDAVAKLLGDAGVAVHTATTAEVTGPRSLRLGSQQVEADRIVALPSIAGPAIRGLPATADGFIPFDAHCEVPGTGGEDPAAGDATDFPVKHGGLSSQQADTAAAAIAFLAGAEVETEPFQPLIRGMLLTGGAPLYMSARLIGTGSFQSEVSDSPLWPSGAKVAAEELGDYLAG